MTCGTVGVTLGFCKGKLFPPLISSLTGVVLVVCVIAGAETGLAGLLTEVGVVVIGLGTG